MGTRGLYGFILNNKLLYRSSSHDSEPGNLGEFVLQYLKEYLLSHNNSLYKATEDDLKYLFEDHDYLIKKIDKIGISNDFASANSLFCEWGYFINLNSKTMDIYIGNWHCDTVSGIFSKCAPSNHESGLPYWPITNFMNIPFKDIHNIDFTDFLAGAVIHNKHFSQPGPKNFSLSAHELLLYYEKIIKYLNCEKILDTNFYHATYRPLMDNIIKKGLGATAKTNWEDSKPGVVYLASDRNVAESYAETSDNVPDEWLDDIIIIKIPSSSLDKSKIFKDENVRNNDNTTIEYHGVIPISKNMIIS